LKITAESHWIPHPQLSFTRCTLHQLAKSNAQKSLPKSVLHAFVSAFVDFS